MALLLLRRSLAQAQRRFEVSVPGQTGQIEDGDSVPLSTERLARNQALFREVNERLYEFGAPTVVSFREFICECSDPSCTKSLAVALVEYEAVRSTPNRFLAHRGHELPERHRVVEDNERFLVIERTVEIELMAESDPLSPSEGK